MPRPTGPRHPLFLRLQKPVPPLFPDRATVVVPNASEAKRGARGVVFLVSRPCAQLSLWARQIREAHATDITYETDDRVSPLSLDPVKTRSLREIGKVRCQNFGDQGAVKSARSADILGWGVTLMAIVLDKPNGTAVGFVSFALDWTIFCERRSSPAEFEVEPDQAWLAPQYRGRYWGDALAYAVALAARMHIDYLDATTDWGVDPVAGVKVLVCADVYSTSGETFLRQCCEHLDIELNLRRKHPRFEVVKLELDPRW